MIGGTAHRLPGGEPVTSAIPVNGIPRILLSKTQLRVYKIV